jgi:hypothetical protein
MKGIILVDRAKVMEFDEITQNKNSTVEISIHGIALYSFFYWSSWFSIDDTVK